MGLCIGWVVLPDLNKVLAIWGLCNNCPTHWCAQFEDKLGPGFGRVLGTGFGFRTAADGPVVHRLRPFQPMQSQNAPTPGGPSQPKSSVLVTFIRLDALLAPRRRRNPPRTP